MNPLPEWWGVTTGWDVVFCAGFCWAFYLVHLNTRRLDRMELAGVNAELARRDAATVDSLVAGPSDSMNTPSDFEREQMEQVDLERSARLSESKVQIVSIEHVADEGMRVLGPEERATMACPLPPEEGYETEVPQRRAKCDVCEDDYFVADEERDSGMCGSCEMDDDVQRLMDRDMGDS